MKAQKECWECVHRQIRKAGERGINDLEKREKVIEEANGIAEKYVPIEPPGSFGTRFHRLLKENSDRDAFEEFRVKGYEIAEKALEVLEPEIKTLKDACIASIIGNYIDSTPLGDDLSKLGEFKNMIHEGLAIDDFEEFETILKNAKSVLYIHDNYGEHLFDLIVVKKLIEMGKEVVSVGKESRILNDATVQDLRDDGFGEYARVVSIGSDCIGVVWDEVSEEFKELFENSDVVISKGMGNYECLDDNVRGVVFMLRAKCEPVARSLGVEKGDNVLKVKKSDSKA